jgi:hypothetical protein
MGFQVNDKNIDSEICRIRSILVNMGLKNTSKSDVLRFLLATKQHSNKIKEAIMRNTKRI